MYCRFTTLLSCELADVAMFLTVNHLNTQRARVRRMRADATGTTRQRLLHKLMPKRFSLQNPFTTVCKHLRWLRLVVMVTGTGEALHHNMDERRRARDKGMHVA